LPPDPDQDPQGTQQHAQPGHRPQPDPSRPAPHPNSNSGPPSAAAPRRPPAAPPPQLVTPPLVAAAHPPALTGQLTNHPSSLIDREEAAMSKSRLALDWLGATRLRAAGSTGLRDWQSGLDLQPPIRLDLAVRARRGEHTRTYRLGGAHAQPPCQAEPGADRATHDRSARAGSHALGRGTDPPIRRRPSRAPRWD
jgi:hypothetical protein